MRTPACSLLVLSALLAVGCASAGPAGQRAAAGPLFRAEGRAAWSAWSSTSTAPSPALPVFADDDEEDEEEERGPVGIGWTILMYIPDRVLDLFDIVRARVRLGPGFAVGARATEYADVFVGAYASVYIGLPGPRGRRFPRLPVGLESKTGAEVSVADVTVEGGLGPDYGMTEFGFGGQLGLIGFDVGIDPGEILDFVLGLFTIDIMDDDL